MRIAISGCGGFIGNVAVRHFLSKGHSVIGMDNFFKGHCDALLGVIGHPKFEFIYGDVTNKKDCEKLVSGATHIVHLASLVGFPICARMKDTAKAVNVGGTENMLAVRNGIQPFVFASTGSVYGAVEGICTEESPINTNTVYGITKYEAEQIVAKEQNTVSFRMATAFGLSPCMRVQLLVNDFCYQAVNNKTFTVFEPDARRTFIHIHDFVDALEFGLLNSEKMIDKVYNCGDNKLNWTKRKLANYIAQKTGAHLFFGEFNKDADCRDYEVSHDKINKLGFYTQVSMEEGINELLKAAPLLRVGNRYEPN